MFREQATSLIDAVVESGGDVSEEEIRAVERLERLVQLEEGTHSRRPRRRVWPVATVLAVTLLVISGLLFARVPETEVELAVNVSEVGFSLVTPEALFRDVSLQAVGISGLARMELPASFPAAFASSPGRTGPDQAIRVASADDGERRGSVTIGTIVPPAGTDVWFEQSELPDQYRLSLRGEQHALRIDVFGPIVVSIAGLGRRVIDVESPQAIVLQPAPPPSVTNLDMAFGEDGAGDMVIQVPARDLRFFRVSEAGDQGGTSIVRSLSTITSGDLRFESLNGLSRQLRRGEALRFASVEGEIRTLGFKNDHLSLNFQGDVSGMETGSRQNARSLMPTWMDWLRARHGLSLLWGSTLYVFGMALAVLRWFGAIQ